MTTTTPSNYPSRVLVRLSSDEGKQSGLPTDSVVMTDNLATILEIAIDREIGELPMDQIDKALRHTLGLQDDLQKSEQGKPQ
jgi:mRNA interferase MazF